MSYNVIPRPVPPKDMQDFTRKIRVVIDKTTCGRHKVPEGVPCFHLRMDSREGYYAGICNVRATKVYNGVASKTPRNYTKNKENQ